MKPYLSILSCLIMLTFSACVEKETSIEIPKEKTAEQIKIEKEKQEKIIEESLKNGAYKFHMYSQEWQEEIDKGLQKDSTIAYLWQQKAMPLFKQRKYEAGMEFIDQAVKYDAQRWQDYRAFIKCIFAKTYRDAIADFEDYKEKFGYGYVMDHSYDFHIALSYLQLNEFKKAEKIFQKDYEYILDKKGDDWLHHLDLFYYGISRYEQKNYEGAIEMFDKALAIYPNFSEVICYKVYCLTKLDKMEEAKVLAIRCQENLEKGNTINEDNVVYEQYPYQMRSRH